MRIVELFRQLGTAEECVTRDFLFFTSWYEGLNCEDGGLGGVVFSGLNDVWAIVGNVLTLFLQLAGIVAVLFIIYGGIRYITSQGEPENIQAAKKVIVNAIVGLVVAILASVAVGFIAGQF